MSALFTLLEDGVINKRFGAYAIIRKNNNVFVRIPLSSLVTSYPVYLLHNFFMHIFVIDSSVLSFHAGETLHPEDLGAQPLGHLIGTMGYQ